MTSLSSLLGILMATLQSHPICERASVLETKVFSHDQFFLNVEAAQAAREDVETGIRAVLSETFA